MKRQLLTGMLAAILALSAGCGNEDDGVLHGETSVSPTESLSKDEELGNAKTASQDGGQGVLENEGQDRASDMLHFFELPETALPFAAETVSKEGVPGGSDFAAVMVDGMEYAALDCSFMSGADEEQTAYFLEKCPEITAGTKLFLRRKQGEAVWEAAVLPDVSGAERNEVLIAFYSKENGMIVLDGELNCARICITEDGGDTWALVQMSDSMAIMNGIYCIYACGEDRFLVGYRYKYLPETGIVYLTEDNGQSWQLAELPEPKAGELKYSYSEPMRIWEEEGKLFMKMRARAEDTEAASRGEFGGYEAYYELISADRGKTWEMVQPEEKLDFQLRTD